MRFVAIALLPLLVLSVSCSKAESSAESTPTPSPTPDAASQVAADEDIFQTTGHFDPDARVGARKAAFDYIHAALPDWTVKGLNAQFYEGMFYVSADVRQAQKTVTLILEVRKFFPETGDSYWKAEPYKRTVEQQIKGVVEK